MPYFSHDGMQLFYRQKGDGKLLLILHGNTASSAVHGGELDYFGQQYCATALDAPGCGQSQRAAEWPVDWWRAYALCAHALVDHLGNRDCLVVGTSGGAIAGLWFAALYPEQVRAAIADSFVPQHDPARLRHEVLEGRAQRLPGQIAFWQQSHGADWEQVIAADNTLLLALAETGGAFLTGCPLQAIHCPVLLTASCSDDLLPANTSLQLVKLAEQLEDGRLYLHSHGGHPLMWSQPQVFRHMADAFLREVLHR